MLGPLGWAQGCCQPPLSLHGASLERPPEEGSGISMVQRWLLGTGHSPEQPESPTKPHRALAPSHTQRPHSNPEPPAASLPTQGMWGWQGGSARTPCPWGAVTLRWDSAWGTGMRPEGARLVLAVLSCRWALSHPCGLPGCARNRRAVWAQASQPAAAAKVFALAGSPDLSHGLRSPAGQGRAESQGTGQQHDGAAQGSQPSVPRGEAPSWGTLLLGSPGASPAPRRAKGSPGVQAPAGQGSAVGSEMKPRCAAPLPLPQPGAFKASPAAGEGAGGWPAVRTRPP